MKSRRQKISFGSPYDVLIQSEFQVEDTVAISKNLRKNKSAPPRKTQQLCRQVAETLNSILSGECRDPVLQTLYVRSVVPAPDASQMLVTVEFLDTDLTISSDEVLRRLQRTMGFLRSQVAAAITRKRAPSLLFHVFPPVTLNAGEEKLNREELNRRERELDSDRRDQHDETD